ncbi:MAG TPA: helix-turn-helix domain-containing protein [Candidatus Blautia stercoripullorum]|uniref:Helix-turn-helix domain-containing protein n=1 Tax=Candidatus Blautia stercoripullorum TaxID=2838502 RepID=A0A9D2RA25_9FIRM|nr:helix-turn-helix domain-containing protein [Candidatus Blautia stercoripullorum]
MVSELCRFFRQCHLTYKAFCFLSRLSSFFSEILQSFSTSQHISRSLWKRQQLHKAKLLLLTTQASITDIAMETGFNSSSTFNRFFQSEKIFPSGFHIFHAKFKN